jgi:hypothetical protein
MKHSTANQVRITGTAHTSRGKKKGYLLKVSVIAGTDVTSAGTRVSTPTAAVEKARVTLKVAPRYPNATARSRGSESTVRSATTVFATV